MLGARMNTALNGDSKPLKSIKHSNDSFWRPNAFLLTFISIRERSDCPVFFTCSSPLFASSTRPAQVPIIGTPAWATFLISEEMPSFSINLPSVVLSPPGMINASQAGTRPLCFIFMTSPWRHVQSRAL